MLNICKHFEKHFMVPLVLGNCEGCKHPVKSHMYALSEITEIKITKITRLLKSENQFIL